MKTGTAGLSAGERGRYGDPFGSRCGGPMTMCVGGAGALGMGTKAGDAPTGNCMWPRVCG